MYSYLTGNEKEEKKGKDTKKCVINCKLSFWIIKFVLKLQKLSLSLNT